ERVGTIFGTISIGSGLGSALGSWTGGLLHDWTHSYNPLIVVSLINVVLGMLPFLVVPALRRSAPRRRSDDSRDACTILRLASGWADVSTVRLSSGAPADAIAPRSDPRVSWVRHRPAS